MSYVRRICSCTAVQLAHPLHSKKEIDFHSYRVHTAVSFQSAIVGEADLAVGNVVGSNIANVLLVLGLSALVVPLVVSSQLVRFDVPLMIVVSLLMRVLAWDGVVGRVDGCILFGGLLAYIAWPIRRSRRESEEVVSEFTA